MNDETRDDLVPRFSLRREGLERTLGTRLNLSWYDSGVKWVNRHQKTLTNDV